MRIFVAIEIPEDVRSALGALVNKLRGICPDARWARLAGLHVTLKFIGEVPPEKVMEIQAALSTVPPRAPIPLTFSGLGFFPNARRPSVLWAGVDAGRELSTLAAAIGDALRLGENRQQAGPQFTPHLTLARFKDRANVEALRKFVESAGTMKFGDMTATNFHLYQSVLKPGGAEYTRLKLFRSLGAQPSEF